MPVAVAILVNSVRKRIKGLGLNTGFLQALQALSTFGGAVAESVIAVVGRTLSLPLHIALASPFFHPRLPPSQAQVYHPAFSYKATRGPTLAVM